ncbi:MAG: hypothetical protein JO166_18460, partial [Deltaproteobacteria bacterium]|nr:hypothetical protein [Deltaproteobacteria bacterium]
MSRPRLAPFMGRSAVIIASGFTAVLAVAHLNGTPYEINFGQTLRAMTPLLSATALPALRLWLVWIIGTGIIAGIILRFDPEIGLLDSLLGGAAGVWAVSYVLGQALGPLGWFNPLVLRILLFAGMIWLIFHQPLVAPQRMSGGQKLALFAFALLAFGLLPLQLGSPVAPYMDVLTYPAAVQRILTFHVYLPFDNDAFGCWGARAQTPALELFYAALAMAGGVKLGVLAHSQVMVPMAGLLIFATYRLGLTMADDIAGGGAALFLFFTTEFRRLTGMRGTAVAFALVALGLAFLFDRERRPVRLAIGGLMLGLAVPSHAIDGGLAMVVAAFGAVLYWINAQRRFCLIIVLILFGASLFALPGVAIGLAWQLPYWVRICAMLAGAGIIASAARMAPGDDKYGFSSPGIIQKTLIISAIGSGIYLQGFSNGTVAALVNEYPLLTLLAFGGLIVSLVSPPSNGISMLVFAVMLEPVYEAVTHVAANWGGDVFQSAFGDIGVKLQDYWCPYFFAMLAGIPLAQLWRARRGYAPVLATALLILLI